MEWRCVGSQPRPTDPHEVESLGVQDVEATAPVHQDLSESGVVDDGVDDEWVVPRVRDVIRVVVMIKHDGLLGPIEERRGGERPSKVIKQFFTSGNPSSLLLPTWASAAFFSASSLG
jgi:hypothetical protein